MTYKITKKNVQEEINAGKRIDGRGLFDLREVQVKFGVSNKSEGSVSVKIGKTEVVAGIKMGVAEPYSDHEDEGAMTTSLELLPLSSPNFEYGQPSIQAVETARIIDRGIREARFIDFKKLCIKEGEKVWNIFIDMATLNDDGNLIDAGALAAVLALMTARFPVYNKEKGKIAFGELSDEPLPLNVENMPLTVTFFKIGDKLFFDPTRDEEEVSDGRLTFEISKGEKEEMINAMQKGGEATFTAQEIETMISEGVKMFKKLKTLVDTELENFERDNKSSKKKKKE
jgi:exosome complex component RRP42